MASPPPEASAWERILSALGALGLAASFAAWLKYLLGVKQSDRAYTDGLVDDLKDMFASESQRLQERIDKTEQKLATVETRNAKLMDDLHARDVEVIKLTDLNAQLTLQNAALMRQNEELIEQRQVYTADIRELKTAAQHREERIAKIEAFCAAAGLKLPNGEPH